MNLWTCAGPRLTEEGGQEKSAGNQVLLDGNIPLIICQDCARATNIVRMTNIVRLTNIVSLTKIARMRLLARTALKEGGLR